jgi:outer membrane protein insertion porin family
LVCEYTKKKTAVVGPTGLFIVLCLLVFPADAQTVIRDIRVEGLQRISAGTVFNYMPLEVGDTLVRDQYSTIIRDLFRTGFFTDVRLEQEGDVLVVKVEERPSISEIVIKGNKDISADDLTEALSQVGLAEGQVFDRSVLDRVRQELREQYFARGKYSVKIETDVTEGPRNTVAVTLDISEGKVALIKDISIIGNEAFDEDDLLDQFELTSPNWLSWLNKRDRYSKPQLTADLESLRSFYQDRGYINFNVDSAQVSISPDRKDIYVDVNITEGDQFSVSEVKLAGQLPVPEAELMALVSIVPGDVFSRAATAQTSQRISDRLGDEGYAFANINTVPEIDPENRQVALTLFVDPGKRVYVRRINYSGNTRTYDEVMRREMRQMEGAWFSTSRVDRSKSRLERLGYFDAVEVETPAVPGSPDQVDVNYAVTERASGNLNFGVGFSQGSGVVLNAGVSQENFLGTGKRVGFNFNNSRVNRTYSFNYVNPYYTVDGLSRGFNIFYRTTDAEEANLSSYVLDRAGASIDFGLPLTEFNRLRFGLGPDQTRVQTTDSTPPRIREILEEEGTDTFTNLTAYASWSHDTRNRSFFTDRGMLNSIGLEGTSPGSDWQFYKINFRHSSYWPLFGPATVAAKADIGYGAGYGDQTDIPFYENYYAGGVRSVRGYKSNTLGPRDLLTDDPIGGSFRTVGGLSLFFPVPFLGDDLGSVRLEAFADGGNVFDEPGDWEFSEIRYGIGLGVHWLSPFGPFSLSFAVPVNDDDDETEPVQFTLGSTF